MLDFLNPCNTDGANWQHWLMLALPFLLGLLFGKGSENNDEASARLSSLEADLAACQNNKRTILAATKASANSFNETQNKVASAPVVEAPVIVAPVVVAAPAIVAPLVVTAPVIATAATSSSKDDLKIVEGIGPKIEGLFNDAGIVTFQQLANTPTTQLKAILNAAGPRYQMHDPQTWPAQSKMAAEGKWDELKAWQEELNKGK